MTVALCAVSGCTISAGVVKYNDVRFTVPGTSGPADPVRTGVPLRGDLAVAGLGGWQHRAVEFSVAASTAFLSYSQLTLFDFEAGARYFPAPWTRFRPYVGAGAGYYRFGWTDTFSTCPPGYHCFPGYDEDFEDSETTILGSGFNPHVAVGANITMTRNWWWVAEAHHEFSKRDQADFGGTEFLLGVRWKPPRR